MPSADETRFLRNVRHALGLDRFTSRSFAELFAPVATRSIPGLAGSRSRQERLALLDRLIEQAAPLQLHVAPVADLREAAGKIVAIAAEKFPEWGSQKAICAWRHPLIDALALPAAMDRLSIPVYFSDMEGAGADPLQKRKATIRRQVAESFIGVTSADYCLAETATVVMRTRPGQARSVSLVPSIHVAVVRLAQILADLGELYALFRDDPELRSEGLTRCMTLISGPSKTADIELVMVHGAHGPREMHLLVVT